MPRILVTADGPDGRQTPVLQERVVASDLESDHFAAQLVERVGWALVDADEIEHRTPSPASPTRIRAKHERAKPRSPSTPLTFTRPQAGSAAPA